MKLSIWLEDQYFYFWQRKKFCAIYHIDSDFISVLFFVDSYFEYLNSLKLSVSRTRFSEFLSSLAIKLEQR